MASFLKLLTEGLRYVASVFLALALPVLHLFSACPAAAPQPMKLGAYYWDGWYEQIPAWTPRLLGEFAGREPVWGWLTDGVDKMEMQIGLAADNGLGFFAFDWYYPESGEINPMNYAVDRFLLSSNNDRMEFCLLVANHSGFLIYPDAWPDFVERVLPYLSSDRALKIGGKPVIIFFSSGELEKCLGGEKQVKQSLVTLREACVEAGLPGCYVMACTFPERSRVGDVTCVPFDWSVSALKYKAMGYDAETGYNYHRGSLPDGSFAYPFRQLNADHELTWKMKALFGLLPYMPVLNGGWDCRPWESGDDDPNRSCYSADRTPEDFYDHVRAAINWTQRNPGMSAGGLAIFYAWNEMGEGGYLLPTKGEGDAVLKAIGRAMAEG